MIEQKGKCVRRDDPGSSAVVRANRCALRAARELNIIAHLESGWAHLESAPSLQTYLESGWNRYAPAMSKSSNLLLRTMLKRQTVRVGQSVENRLKIKALLRKEKKQEKIEALEVELAKAKRVSVQAFLRQEKIKHCLEQRASWRWSL